MTTVEATVPRATAAPKVGWLRSFLSNPWGRPRFLSVWTWLYIIWTIAPVVIAVQFSFNAGRSRSTFQGFSLQWYDGIWNEVGAAYREQAKRWHPDRGGGAQAERRMAEINVAYDLLRAAAAHQPAPRQRRRIRPCRASPLERSIPGHSTF